MHVTCSEKVIIWRSHLQVQQTAQAAIADGCQHPDLLRLARLGSSGLFPGNCHRDLQRFLKLSDKMPNTVAMALPLEVIQGEVETATVPMMPLHRLLACSYEHHRCAFARRFAGLDGAIVTFWKGVEPADPKLMAWAPALAQKPSYNTHCNPLASHGDGVPVLSTKPLCHQCCLLVGHWHQH